MEEVSVCFSRQLSFIEIQKLNQLCLSKRKIWLTLKLTDPVLSLSNRRKIWSRNLLTILDTCKVISKWRLLWQYWITKLSSDNSNKPPEMAEAFSFDYDILCGLVVFLVFSSSLNSSSSVSKPDCSLHWHVVHLEDPVAVQHSCWADCFEPTAHIYRKRWKLDVRKKFRKIYFAREVWGPLRGPFSR